MTPQQPSTAGASEAEKLRAAIKRAGFSVMQTSGDWQIFDVSEQGKAADAKSLAVADENIELSLRLERLLHENESLAKFKAYVHKRLDDAGVPADPDSPHKAEGCRIGGRLDIVLAAWNHRPGMQPLRDAVEKRIAATPIDAICDEIKAARLHGQQKYGGRDPVGHDLSHKASEWLAFARDHLERADSRGPRSLEQREHYIKAAGLLLSLIWAEDVNAGRIPLMGCNDSDNGHDALVAAAALLRVPGSAGEGTATRKERK